MLKQVRWVVMMTAVGCLLAGFTLVGAQPAPTSGGGRAAVQGPRLGETQVDPEYKGELKFMARAAGKGVHAFLGGAYGSHWLNGAGGKVLYRLPGNDDAEEYELVWEQTTANYYYYHEKDYKEYKWRFGRWNSGGNNFLVQHTRPQPGWENAWRTVHYAYLSDLPETTSLKTKREKK